MSNKIAENIKMSKIWNKCKNRNICRNKTFYCVRGEFANVTDQTKTLI